MDLNDILNKTKKRSEQIKVVHKPPSIASTDRPYSEDDLPKGTANFISNTENTSLETDNKPATNWQQTGNRTDNKLATNWQQTDNKKERKNKTGNKLATELATELATNWQQTGNKPTTKMTFSML